MPLEFSEISLPCAEVGSDSCTPSIFPVRNVQTEKKMYITEDDEIFYDYGRINTILPYKMQVLNGRERRMKTLKTAVLENDYLKAVFLPEFGARLWSLYDKVAGRELLYVNDCIQPGNLALCGAWFSGGVEWNIGMIGHSPFTCRPLSMARVETPDGGEALRFYGFERVREAVFQMDFFLPEDSRALLCRMRIKNTLNETIPMYWFSNIAVPEDGGSRVVVPADESYYSGIGYVKKTDVPFRDTGVDISYPAKTLPSTDYFYKIPDRSRRFIAYADCRGQGMFQTSTSRMRGRKLFVWGQGTGADRWQQWLTNNAGRYIEIQAGVGRTQYECIPMPPGAAWEWVEAYGPLEVDAAELHGDYCGAVKVAADCIEKQIGEEWLERFLVDTKPVALTPAERVFASEDDGWAALEIARRRLEGKPAFEVHLDFGEPVLAQAEWLELLLEGRMRDMPTNIPPGSYMASPDWQRLLEQAEVQNWFSEYHCGILHFAQGNLEQAKAAFKRSLGYRESAWAYYGLAVIAYILDDADAAALMESAMECEKSPEDSNFERIEMVRDYFRILLRFDMGSRLVERFLKLPEKVRNDGHVQLLATRAYLSCDALEEAESVLMKDGGLVMPDFREGTNELSDTWLELQRKKALARGEQFDATTVSLPLIFDFRMEYGSDDTE